MNIIAKTKHRILVSIQIRLSRIWRDTPFFIQSQMDIHPNSEWYSAEFAERTGGFFPKDGSENCEIVDHDSWDGVRRDMMLLLLKSIEDRRVPGRFAELGVYKGGTAQLIHMYSPNRELELFDTFEGFDRRDMQDDEEKAGHIVDEALFKDTGLELVKLAIASKNDNVHFHKGFFPESFPPALAGESFAFVHLDADLYAPILAGLKLFYPLLSGGGFLVVHDYNAWIGARQAVDEFSSERGLIPIPMPDKSGSCIFVKPFSTL